MEQHSNAEQSLYGTLNRIEQWIIQSELILFFSPWRLWAIQPQYLRRHVANVAFVVFCSSWAASVKCQVVNRHLEKALRCPCDSLLRCFHYQRWRRGGHHRGLSCLQHLVYHRCVWLLRGPGMLWQKCSLLLHVWCFYHQSHSFIGSNCTLNSLGEFAILISFF